MEIKKYLVRFNLISSSKDKKDKEEEKQIYLITTIEGVKVYYYSGHRINPKNFISDRKLSIYQARKNTFNKSGESASTINSRLRELENASLIVFEQNFKGRDIEFSKDLFKKHLQIQLNEYEEIVSEQKEQIVNLLTLHNSYIDYLKEKKSYHRYHKADHNKYLRYSAHLNHDLDVNTIDIIHYSKYLSKSLSTNSLVTNMKRVRTFFKWLKKKKYIQKSPFENIDFSEDIGIEIYDEPI